MSSIEALAWLLLLPILASLYKEITSININTGDPQKKTKTKLFIKLLFLLPIFLYLPWQPSSCNIRAALSIVMLWTGPAKLIMLALNKPIDHLQNWSFATFLIMIMLPVSLESVKSDGKSNPTPTPNDAGSGRLWKILALVAILNCYQIWDNMAEPLRYLLYCVHFYLGLELYMSGLAEAARSAGVVAVSEPFYNPLGSSTLADFWGRRWNRVVGGLLRATVYEPVVVQMSGQCWRVDIRVAKVVGGLATFLVSGLFHEIIFGYVTRTWPAGHMTAFFVVNGVGCVVQSALFYDRSTKKITCSPWLARVSTLGFIYFTACLFFMKSLRKTGTDLDSIAEYHSLQTAILSPLLRLLH